MSITQRKQLIGALEKEVGAKIVTLVTGDRGGMETRIAGDSLPVLAALLSRLNDVQEQIALFLYTPGGETISGWGIVNLLRQYGKKLAVVVPFRALSTGTLIALGADDLYLGRHGFLSPVDPSVASPYNPAPPGPESQGPRQLMPVSVEDLSGFLDLARKELNLTDQESLVNVLRMLSDKVHPLALGAVYRAREQSGSLARRLLESHMDDRGKIAAIVDKLTRELPTHSYLIGHDEAKNDIGIPLMNTTPQLESAMWNLYLNYAEWLKLTEPHSPMLDLGSEQTKRVTYERAAIEILNEDTLYSQVFVSVRSLNRVTTNQQGVPIEQVAEHTIYQGWRLTQG
jgi:hypothetical protein